MSTQPTPSGGPIDVNAVVSYNLRAIRRQRAMTQNQLAAALARFTGRRLTQAAISAMERGPAAGRRRRFDAHDLYLLSAVFGVPIVYFFLPPAGDPRPLADTGRPAHDLYTAALGTNHPLDHVIDSLTAGADPIPAGADTPEREHRLDDYRDWFEDYRAWRERMAELDGIADGFDNPTQNLLDALYALRRTALITFCPHHRKDHPR